MEFYEKNSVSFYLSQLTPICEFDSAKQKVGLYRHPLLGRVLILNGEIQHIENYQYLYHESLVHVSAAFIKSPKNCLILGGGSLFAAFEVLKYPSIERVVLCDFDHAVIDLMIKNYEHAQQVKKDKRFNFIEEDAKVFIKDLNEEYDLIISDCFDLAEMNNGFSMYDRLFRLCSEQGVCSDVIYRHIFDKDCLTNSLGQLKSQANLALSLVIIPEYPGVLHLQIIWGKNRNVHQNQKHTFNEFQHNLANLEKFKMFTPNNLPYYLYLPPYLKKFVLQETFCKAF